MKAPTMFISWAGMPAVPSRQSSWCSWSSTRTLRCWCQCRNESTETATQTPSFSGRSPVRTSDDTLDGSTVRCPNHGAQFNVCTGEVLRGPATDPLKTYRLIVDGDIGE